MTADQEDEGGRRRKLAQAALDLANDMEGSATITLYDKQDRVMAEVEANPGETVEVVLERMQWWT